MTFATDTEYNGIQMTLAGQWQDMAAYYRGDDGSAWTYNQCTRSWSNCGDYAEFVATFDQRRRGKLIQLA